MKVDKVPKINAEPILLDALLLQKNGTLLGGVLAERISKNSWKSKIFQQGHALQCVQVT